jgi:hypothetical protein
MLIETFVKNYYSTSVHIGALKRYISPRLKNETDIFSKIHHKINISYNP